MSKIISVSRRTDIPSFYSEWFNNRISDGFTEILNPYNNRISKVSLLKNDVFAFVFWSKNYIPFMTTLNRLKEMNYNFYFNYTITGLPSIFEESVIDTESTINNMIELSKTYGKETINWRYDPIIISNITDEKYHLEKFESMCSKLNGYVSRCYFSFLTSYLKIKSNIEELKLKNIQIIEVDDLTKINLSIRLSEIAKKYNITLYSCSNELLVNSHVQKAHCVDLDIIESLFGTINIKEKPTRIGCGCYDSVDIGSYDTCPHGCFYCYANTKKLVVKANYLLHNSKSTIL